MGLHFSMKGSLTVAALACVGFAHAAVNLSVSLGDSIRPVTHVATGSLYGLTETYPVDIDKEVAPLKPNVFLAPARSGKGRQQGIGGAFLISPRIENTTGKVQIRLADILPGWPYEFQSMDHWLSEVGSVVADKKASKIQNFDGYEIWNEPNDTWKVPGINFNSDLWKKTYDFLRKNDPQERIVGPSYSWYNADKMEEFVKYCSANNCMPDIISWHQWGSGGFVGAIKHYRGLEKKYGVSPRAISINEYSSTKHPEEGCPGVSVPFIAKFERHGVESAMISWWFTNLPGRLGSLLTANNERGGGWWLYKWYADMSGYMAKVVPPNDESDGVDGFAALDVKKNFASIVVGGNTLGDVSVDISGIPAAFGEKVNVAVEYVTWVDKDKAVPSTTPESSKEYSVNGGKITVPIKISNVYNAYRIYVTPIVPQKPFGTEAAAIPGKIQVENFDINGTGAENTSYFDTDDENKGNVYREDGVDLEAVEGEQGNYAIGYTIAGEWLEYTVNVKTDGSYPLTIRAASGGSSGSVRFYVDGKEASDTIAIPQTAENKWNVYENIDGGEISLTAGTHILKMAITGSYANIDWIEFGETAASDTEDSTLALGDRAQKLHFENAPRMSSYAVFDIQGNFIGRVMSRDVASAMESAKNMIAKSGAYIIKSSTGLVRRFTVK